MRCSDCFGEMVENEGFIQCTSCGRILQAIPEDPEQSFMDRLRANATIREGALPVPLPIVAAGAALTVITSAVLLSFTLSGDGGADGAAGRTAGASPALATSTLDGQQTGPWLTQVTALPAASLLVSAVPSASGFAVVMQRGDRGPAGDGGMQIALLDSAGVMSREVSPVLPQSWLLTHAAPTGRGDVAVLGQTADGLFLFRVDRDGQPVWGRFESADETGSASGASLLRTGEMLVIAAPSARGIGLDLVAYDSDGRRLWNQTLADIVAGSYALTGTPAGELLMVGNVAGEDGASTPRFIRLDRTGTIQVDAPLSLPDGNRVNRASVAGDDSVYVLSTGTAALVQRFSPRGVEQWQAALDDWPASGDAGSDLEALPSGAIVTRLGMGTLHAARISGSGLDVSMSRVSVPDGLSALGTRIAPDGRTVAVLMADQAPATPRLVHAQADLRDLFRNGNGVANGPIRTVAIDEVTTRRAQEPQAGAPAAEKPAIRGATEAPITRQPIDQPPAPVEVSARADAAPAAVQARFADCTFVCMPEGVPAAKYPVTRSYQLGDGRTLNDITLDAFADHEGFCLETGGLAHAGSVPICEQQ